MRRRKNLYREAKRSPNKKRRTYSEHCPTAQERPANIGEKPFIPNQVQINSVLAGIQKKIGPAKPAAASTPHLRYTLSAMLPVMADSVALA